MSKEHPTDHELVDRVDIYYGNQNDWEVLIRGNMGSRCELMITGPGKEAAREVIFDAIRYGWSLRRVASWCLFMVPKPVEKGTPTP